jgi:hypothetical protein
VAPNSWTGIMGLCPVGYGMIGSDRRATVRTINQPGGRDQTVPYGTDSGLNAFPGNPAAAGCLETITSPFGTTNRRYLSAFPTPHHEHEHEHEHEDEDEDDSKIEGVISCQERRRDPTLSPRGLRRRRTNGPGCHRYPELFVVRAGLTRGS